MSYYDVYFIIFFFIILREKNTISFLKPCYTFLYTTFIYNKLTTLKIFSPTYKFIQFSDFVLNKLFSIILYTFIIHLLLIYCAYLLFIFYIIYIFNLINYTTLCKHFFEQIIDNFIFLIIFSLSNN